MPGASLSAALFLLAFCAAFYAPAAAALAPIYDFGTGGQQGGQLNGARGIAVNSTGNGGVPAGTIYVADFNNRRIQSFDADGNFIRAWGADVDSTGGTGFEICEAAESCKQGASGGAAGAFNGIAGGIAVDQATGNVSIFDRDNRRIQQLDATGSFIRAWGADVDSTGGTGFEVCEVAANCKQGVAGTGAGMFAATNAIAGIAADSAGNLYVADAGNSRVQKFSPSGAFLAMGGWDVIAPGKAGNLPNNEEQTVTIGGGPTGGTFTLSWNPGTGNQTTAPIAFNAPATGAGSVQEALEALAALEPGDVAVSGSPGGPWTVEFTGARADTDVPQMAGNAAGLTPAGGKTVTVATADPGASYEVCTVAADCKAGAGGTAPGQFNSSTPTPSFLSASPAGDVYVVGQANGTIYHLTSALAYDPTFAPPEVPSTGNNRNAMAFDSGSGHLFFTKPTGSSLFELDPVTELVVATHAAGGTEWVGLAVNPVSGRMYGTRTTTATFVRIFDEGTFPKEPKALAATNNTGTKATLNGSINPNGAELTQCFFEWGTSTQYGNTAPCAETPAAIGSGTSSVAVHADITGLIPNGTKYNFRLVAANPGVVKSSNQSFLTPDTVITLPPSSLSGTGATLNGTVNPDGGAVQQCFFEYGPTTAYGQTAPCVPNAAAIGSGTSPVSVHADVTGLEPVKTYHFRLRVAYPSGPVSGDDIAFQTLGPAIASTWAEDVTDTGAMLKAEIDPEGVATTYRFEYGTTDAYGQQTPELAVGSDSILHEVGYPIEGLEPGTTYHYRVVATNADASNEGADQQLLTYPAPSDPATDCPNQDFRVGPAAFLPDCRAYEMVSPVNKNGGDIEALSNPAASDQIPEAHDQSSSDGDGLTYSSKVSFGDAVGAPYTSQYIARRHPTNGWSTHGISPPREGFAGTNRQLLESEFKLFSEDLSQGWLVRDADPPLAGCAPPDSVNIYRRFNDSDRYEELNCVPIESSLGLGRTLLELQGVSADGCRAVFRTKAKLTPDANPSSTTLYQLYQHDCAGVVRLVGKLPDGTACAAESSAGTPGGEVNHRSGNVQHAFSVNADRLYWTCGNTLYLRTDPNLGVAGDEEVVAVASGARFLGASPDGSTALYTAGGSLYRYDATANPKTSTEIAGGLPGVNNVLGVSEDASRAYFVSTQVLPGAGANSEGDEATVGQSNLYLYESDLGGPDFTFVATLLSSTDLIGQQKQPSPLHRFHYLRASRITPDGLRATFISTGSLTGYDNSDRANGTPAAEVFLYDATANGGDGELVCVSCNPSGARPLAGNISPNTADGFVLGAASIPGWVNQFYASRALSEDGSRLFFESFDALVLRDTNGRRDVYQWQRVQSEEQCDEAGGELFVAEASGCISLISSGQDPEDSGFVDADPTGENVFIRTGESLLAQDPGLVDIYDARVGGGFPQPALEPGCEGDACQSPPSPPSFQTPSSFGFAGPGDPAAAPRKPRRCPKGKRKVVRRGKARCVKKQLKRQRLRQANRKHGRAAR